MTGTLYRAGILNLLFLPAQVEHPHYLQLYEYRKNVTIRSQAKTFKLKKEAENEKNSVTCFIYFDF
ncbi:hypothetical protein MASR1M68_00100 [Elusimicrobiota bacterium]